MLGSVVKFLKNWESIKDSINQMTRESKNSTQDEVDDNNDGNDDNHNSKFLISKK